MNKDSIEVVLFKLVRKRELTLEEAHSQIIDWRNKKLQEIISALESLFKQYGEYDENESSVTPYEVFGNKLNKLINELKQTLKQGVSK